MNDYPPRFAELFSQLGLPADRELIYQFIQLHRPLRADILLEDASFWTDQQSQFLKDSIKHDADWAQIVDSLNLVLRAPISTTSFFEVIPSEMSIMFRSEYDGFGKIEVPQDSLWGAQTQRSIEHFAISTEKMPLVLIKALANIKSASAQVNQQLGLLEASIAHAIINTCDEIIAGKHDSQFPLSIWQTGSGTQTNMNLNEVIANRASELLGGQRGMMRLVHSNDHVNLGQSSNDVFPTAIHLAGLEGLTQHLIPNLEHLIQTLNEKASRFSDIIKVGRTHLQDATPITLGQEISGWAAQLELGKEEVLQSYLRLNKLAIGATAVGTGINTHPQFGEMVCVVLSKQYNMHLQCAENRFAALAAHEAIISSHSSLKLLATSLIKIANDIRWLASGPRSGLGEISIPENEPGSSIMPGKVNPTQCEALTMVCCQIMGNDVAMTIGGSMGNFELNVFKPLLAHNFLQSIRLLADSIQSFEHFCVAGIEPKVERIKALLNQSLMLATALSPHIGYDKAAQVAKYAQLNETTLSEASIALGFLTQQEFDDWVNPKNMV